MRTNRLLDSNATFQGLGNRTIANRSLQWQLTLVGQREIDGKTYYLYQVKNVRTQWCLDSHLIKRPGVYMHKCNGNEFQQWSLWDFSDCTKLTSLDCLGLVNLKTSQVVRDYKGKKVLEIENYRLRFIHMT